MVVVVPALSHGQEAQAGEVVSLDRVAFENPPARPSIVGEIADQPVAGQREGDATRNAEQDPGQPSEEIEGNGEDDLLAHPGFFEELVEPVFSNARLDLENGGMGELETTMQVVDPVFPERGLVDVEPVTPWVPLRPIPDVVQIEHGEGPTHSDKSAEVDEKVFQPARCLKTSMNQQSVQTDGVTGAESHDGEKSTDEKGRPGEPRRHPNDPEENVGGIPERLGWIPADPAFLWIAVRIDRAHPPHGLSSFFHIWTGWGRPIQTSSRPVVR